MNIADLKKPFDPVKVSFRVGSTNAQYVNGKKDPSTATKGIGLAYIDARDVMERLDEVCGPENWQGLHPHANGKTSCKIGIRVKPTLFKQGEKGIEMCESDWVWKENGAGDTDIEGEKGAFSDAFKRAAVLWGIGRYLYDMPNKWVDLEPGGKKFTASAMKQLQAALTQLSNGQKPVIVEKPRENVRLVSELNQLKTPAACVAWYDESAFSISTLPDEQKDEVMEQYEAKLKSIEDGTAKPGTWKFENVAAQDKWIETAKSVFDRCDTLMELAIKQDSVEHKIQALEMKRKMSLIDYILKRKGDIEKASQATQLPKAG